MYPSGPSARAWAPRCRTAGRGHGRTRHPVAASGVARWLTPVKALIQLSLRYGADDHLWFTFFHEVDHVLRLGKSEVRIEGTTGAADDPDETKADRFARGVLIPPKDAAKLCRLNSPAAIRKFAARIGIAPGIVVGRLQHDNFWPRSRGNHLKGRLALADAAVDA